MRRLILASALLPLAAPAAAGVPDSDLSHATEALGDPARQEALAQSLGVMAEVLLDLPLAPLMASVAEAAGEDPKTVDPDMTLRKMAPGAGEVPRAIERNLPRAMSAMAGMGDAISAVLPQLEAMAAQVVDALPAEPR